jgi:hypothetical protein
MDSWFIYLFITVTNMIKLLLLLAYFFLARMLLLRADFVHTGIVSQEFKYFYHRHVRNC